MKQAVVTSAAPKAAAVYSTAVKSKGDTTIYVSGQIPMTPDGQFYSKPSYSITQQAELVIGNIKNILKAANASLEDVVKVNIFLADINDFQEFNATYAKHFSVLKVVPARSCVQVGALPLGSNLEIECIAVIDE
ncbi:hypothetical protein QEN19_003288 [Hanseniaspora menglaensis]